MSGLWSFMLCDANGNNLAELSTAAGRTIAFKRNSYTEVNLTLSHEDDAARLLLTALANTGVPKLKGYRLSPGAQSSVLRFRGYLAGLSESSDETSTLTATFRSPFGVLAGDGNATGRFVQIPSLGLGVLEYLATDAGVIAKGLIDVGNADLSVGASPTTAVNDSSNGGTVAWGNPTNVFADDSSYAAAVLTSGQNAEWLKVGGYGFSIPAAATIVGIQVDAYYQYSFTGGGGGGVTLTTDTNLVKAGVVQSGHYSTSGGATVGADRHEIWGGPSDLWNNGWSPADINNSGFGVAIDVGIAGENVTQSVNYIAVTIYYSLGSGGFTGLATNASWITPTVIRDRDYPIGQNIGSAVTDLTSVLDGFDFYESFVDGTGSTDADFYVVPSLGATNPSVRFEYGPSTLSNIQQLTRTTTPPTNCIFVTGGNDLTSTYIDQNSVGEYGEWWAHYDFPTVIEQTTLDAKARALVRPAPIKTVSFVPELGLANCPKPFDDWNLGDTVTLYALRKSLTENSQVRINGYTIPIDENGYETVQVSDATSPEEDAVIKAQLVAEVLWGTS